MFHLSGALSHSRCEKKLSGWRKLKRLDFHCERSLVGNREGTKRLQFVTKEVQAKWMLGRRRKHIDNATAHGKLATTRDDVDTRVGHPHQLASDDINVIPSPTSSQYQGLSIEKIVRQGLQESPHGCEYEQRARSIPPRYLPQRIESSSRYLGTRAQSLVGQGLPCGEIQHDRIGGKRANGFSQ